MTPLVVTVFILWFVAPMTHAANLPQPSPFTIEARQRVIFGDTDQMGVVYYANYLRWFELARLEYLRARGGDYPALEQAGYALPVITAHAEYKASARYEDIVLIRAHIAELRRVSFRFDYEIVREGDGLKLCTGYTVHACIARTGRPAPMPKALVALLQAP